MGKEWHENCLIFIFFFSSGLFPEARTYVVHSLCTHARGSMKRATAFGKLIRKENKNKIDRDRQIKEKYVNAQIHAHLSGRHRAHPLKLFKKKPQTDTTVCLLLLRRVMVMVWLDGR